MKNAAKKLRDILNSGERGIMAPCCFDAISAKAIQEAGFPIVSTTGFGVHGSVLGAPDKGTICYKEMLDICNNIINAVDVPVISDAEGGYGNAINTIRTVQNFEKVGLGGLFIEDQKFPPNCPYLKKTELVSLDEMVGKIEAAVEARQDQDFVIIARTDAPFDEAVERAKAYMKAGADMIKFIPHSKEEMERYPSMIDAPLHIGMDESGIFTGHTAKSLGELGYTIVSYPFACLFSYTKAVRESMKKLYETGSAAAIQDMMLPLEDYRKFIGDDEIRDLETKFVRK